MLAGQSHRLVGDHHLLTEGVGVGVHQDDVAEEAGGGGGVEVEPVLPGVDEAQLGGFTAHTGPPADQGEDIWGLRVQPGQGTSTSLAGAGAGAGKFAFKKNISGLCPGWGGAGGRRSHQEPIFQLGQNSVKLYEDEAAACVEEGK